MKGFHWFEQLDHNNEVVRVFTNGKHYVARVVIHRDRTWRAEHRGNAYGWRPFVQAPRGPYKATPVRQWRSPQAAMRAVETLFTRKAGEL